MTNRKKRIIIGCTFLFVAILASAIVVYTQRNDILSMIISRQIKKTEERHALKITYRSVSLNGFNNVKINKLLIIPQNRDTLLSMDSIDMKINLMPLLRKEIEITDLKLQGGNLLLTNENGKRNFDFIFKKKNSNSETNASSYTEKVSRLLSFFFHVIPENMEVSEMNILIRSPQHSIQVHLPESKIVDHKFHSTMKVSENGETQYFIVDGSLSRKQKKLEYQIYAAENKPIQIPYLKYKYNTEIDFDTLSFSFYPLQENKKLVQLGGTFFFLNLNVQNERLSSKNVAFGDNRLDYRFNIEPDYFELDSASTVWINRLNFHPYVYFKRKPDVKITASVRKENFPADDLFSSFPDGLFQNLEGIKTTGNLSYNFYFSVDFSNIDSLQFHSSLDRHNFKVVRFGNTDFREMNEPFSYTAYEDGAPVKTFWIGEAYPHFRKLEQISPYLKAAVLFSEDGDFYYHRGFIESSIRESIIKDLKEKRFARGGSTISMQLVKNLYLNRNKTLMRKGEEAMIVWLIENLSLVPKDRMYEVYLNIIEWGPGIYGADEAAHFYFNKNASQLTPEEAIFMACIVSRPKKFMWLFDKDRKLKPFLSGFYRIVGNRMYKHGYISDVQLENLQPNVDITGSATMFLPNVDNDSIYNETKNDIEEDLLKRQFDENF